MSKAKAKMEFAAEVFSNLLTPALERGEFDQKTMNAEQPEHRLPHDLYWGVYSRRRGDPWLTPVAAYYAAAQELARSDNQDHQPTASR